MKKVVFLKVTAIIVPIIIMLCSIVSCIGVVKGSDNYMNGARTADYNWMDSYAGSLVVRTVSDTVVDILFALAIGLIIWLFANSLVKKEKGR